MYKRQVPGKISRKPTLINDVNFNSLLINCRSLKPKLASLAENFRMNRSHLALLTETWFYKSDSQLKSQLTDFKDEHGISLIRKDRDSRGGGVAVAFDSHTCNFKKLVLNSLQKSRFEIVGAVGKLNGVKKEHIVFSCYPPPNYTRDVTDSFFETLVDAISEARAKHPGSWLTIGGDWNERSLSPIAVNFPDLDWIRSGPTRKSKTLDILVTNYRELVHKVFTNSPLESEVGTKSDHKVLAVETLLTRPRSYTWEVHEYLKITPDGNSKLSDLIKGEVWGTVKDLAPNNHLMAAEFHRVLDAMIMECFEWKRSRRKSNNKPWISDNLRKSIKQRAAIFLSLIHI